MLPDGGSRFFVEVTRRVDVQVRRAARVLRFVLKGARIVHRNNENALVTVHFNTPVSSARLLPSGRDLIFSVDLRAESEPSWKVVAEEDGSATLQVDFPKGNFVLATASSPPSPASSASPPPTGSPSGN
jgi:hypothetical protein